MPEGAYSAYTKEPACKGPRPEFFAAVLRSSHGSVGGSKCAYQFLFLPALWLWAPLRCRRAPLPRFRISGSRRARPTSSRRRGAAAAASIPIIGAVASRTAGATTGTGMTGITAAATSGRGGIGIITGTEPSSEEHTFEL